MSTRIVKAGLCKGLHKLTEVDANEYIFGENTNYKDISGLELTVVGFVAEHSLCRGNGYLKVYVDRSATASALCALIDACCKYGVQFSVVNVDNP